MAGILFHIPDSTPAGIGGIDEYTVLMMHMDGDQSDSNHTVTMNGDPQFSTAQSKFGGSSMNFDGNDYLSVPTHSDFAFGTSDYTIDGWVYFTSAFSDGVYRPIYDRETDGDNFENIIVYQTSGTIKIGWACFISNSAQFNIEPTVTINPNTWYHIACVRASNVQTIYLDGVPQSPTANWSGSMPQYGTTYIGYRAYASNYHLGYIDELRVSGGVARWTADFSSSLPSAPYTSDANTKLLLHLDGDVSDGAHVVTSNGDSQLNAATTKFDGSMLFDGSTTYMTAPDNADFDFGTDPFTIDMWVNLNSLSGGNRPFCGGSLADGAWNMWFGGMGEGWGGGFKVSFGVYTGSGYNEASHSASASTGIWYHLAYVRNDNVITYYWDGTSVGTLDVTGQTINTGGSGLVVGCRYNTSSSDRIEFFNGYMDELRISKGIARWTSNFTPETGPYTT